MAYMHIDNLYKSQDILLFRECWALEKVHGTSAHVAWKDEKLRFFSGGEKHARFVGLFLEPMLADNFRALGHPSVTVYGEAYGGKQQGMRQTYGDELRFIVFDVRIGDAWLAVPDMHQVATGLGLEVVPYRKVSTNIESLDAERDLFSKVAERRGCGSDKPQEGIVLRPPIEVTKSNGARIIAKHKGEKFSERASSPKVVDPAKLAVLAEADEIAQEWVTRQRLTNVLSHMPPEEIDIKMTSKVIRLMVEDVAREGEGEFVDSKPARKAISSRAAKLFKEHLNASIGQSG